jgi:hypothetical protein
MLRSLRIELFNRLVMRVGHACRVKLLGPSILFLHIPVEGMRGGHRCVINPMTYRQPIVFFGKVTAGGAHVQNLILSKHAALPCASGSLSQSRPFSPARDGRPAEDDGGGLDPSTPATVGLLLPLPLSLSLSRRHLSPLSLSNSPPPSLPTLPYLRCSRSRRAHRTPARQHAGNASREIPRGDPQRGRWSAP